jgi:hypothetical protein
LRRRTTAVVIAALAVLSPATSRAQQQPQPSAEPESVGIRLAEAPEALRDDPRARVYIIDHLQQGATISRKVEVLSTLKQAADVRMYVGAAHLENGGFRFGVVGEESDLTEWSSVEPSTVHLEPGGSQLATVTIAVPTDATDGERYGVVWAELPGSGGQANQVNRVGVRIYLSVGEGSEPESDFTIEQLTAARDEEGRPVVETSVTNTGGRALDLSGELQLAEGPGSLSAGPFDVQLGTTLAPTETDAARVVLDKDLPDGPWKATVTIRSGRLEKTATATVTFPSEAGVVAAPVDASSTDAQRKVLLPIALALVVLVALALWLLWRRRRHDEEPQRA